MKVEQLVALCPGLDEETILEAWNYVSDKITLQPYLLHVNATGKNIPLIGRDINGYIIRNIWNVIAEETIYENIPDIEGLDDYECTIDEKTLAVPTGTVYFVDNTISTTGADFYLICSVLPTVYAEDPGFPEDPSLTAVPNTLSFIGDIMESMIQSYVLTGANLLFPVIVTAPKYEDQTIFYIKKSTGGWTTSLTITPSLGIVSETIQVLCLSSFELTDTLIINNRSGTLSAPVQLLVDITEPEEPEFDPVLYIVPDTLAFDPLAVGGEAILSYVVIGINLTGNVEIESQSADFTISETLGGTFSNSVEITPINYFVHKTIYVKINSDTVGEKSSTVTHNSTDCDKVVLTVTGEFLSMPLQDSLMWWLEESFGGESKFTLDGTKISAWQSMDPLGLVFTSCGYDSPWGPSYDIIPALLRPNAVTDYIESALTPVTVAEITGYNTNASRNIRNKTSSYSFTNGFYNVAEGRLGIAVVSVCNCASFVNYNTIASIYGTNSSIFYSIRLKDANTLMAHVSRPVGGLGSPQIQYAYTDLPENLSSMGWIIIVAIYTTTTSTDTQNMVYYIGNEDTIIKLGPTLFDDPPIGIGTAKLDFTVSGMKFNIAHIGIGETSDLDSPNYTFNGKMAVNAAYKTILTTEQVRDIFAYYKLKYPNIFSYDPDDVLGL